MEDNRDAVALMIAHIDGNQTIQLTVGQYRALVEEVQYQRDEAHSWEIRACAEHARAEEADDRAKEAETKASDVQSMNSSLHTYYDKRAKVVAEICSSPARLGAFNQQVLEAVERSPDGWATAVSQATTLPTSWVRMLLDVQGIAQPSRAERPANVVDLNKA